VLHDHVTSPGEADVEITKAIEENEVVMFVHPLYRFIFALIPRWKSGSQEERIGILKLALTEKGVLTSHHYDLTPIGTTESRRPPETDVHTVQRTIGRGTTSTPEQEPEDEDGIHL
jgi:hypothetical protein